MRINYFLFITIAMSVAGCASDFERRTAKLEKELNIQDIPMFPKCTVQEIDPKLGAIHRRSSGSSHTVHDPMGHVPIDECVAYQHDLPDPDR